MTPHESVEERAILDNRWRWIEAQTQAFDALWALLRPELRADDPVRVRAIVRRFAVAVAEAAVSACQRQASAGRVALHVDYEKIVDSLLTGDGGEGRSDGR